MGYLESVVAAARLLSPRRGHFRDISLQHLVISSVRIVQARQHYEEPGDSASYGADGPDSSRLRSMAYTIVLGRPDLRGPTGGLSGRTWNFALV